MKTVIIRAKLAHNKRTYRDIEISHNDTLFDLAGAILTSFEFEMDHLFGFGNNPKDYYKSPQQINYQPYDKNDAFAQMFGEQDEGDVEKTKLSKIPFFQKEKDKMSFLFDYGDDWMFEIELVGFRDRDDKHSKKYPMLLISSGEAPKQYG